MNISQIPATTSSDPYAQLSAPTPVLQTYHDPSRADASSSSTIKPGSILRYFQPVKSLKRKASSAAPENSAGTSANGTPLASTTPSQPRAAGVAFIPRVFDTAQVSSSPAAIPVPTPAPTHTSKKQKESAKKQATRKPKSDMLAKPSAVSSTLKSAVASSSRSRPTSSPVSHGANKKVPPQTFTTPHLSWARRHETLLITTTSLPPPILHADYTSGTKKIAIAAFDLDSTVVKTQSQTPFPKDGSDWMWFNSFVQGNMRALVRHQTINKSKRHAAVYDLVNQESVSPVFRRFLKATNPENIPYFVAIISNQGGVIIKEDTKRYNHFKERLDHIAEALEIPFWCYAATRAQTVKKQPAAKNGKGSSQQPAAPKEKDIFRKPECGMWYELMADAESMGLQVDLERSFFVGDAAGRKNDFSDSDREFAKTLDLQFFTPEEFFINDNPLVNKSTKI